VRTGHGCERAVKRVGTARLHEVQLDAQRPGLHVRLPHMRAWAGLAGFPEDGHAGDGGKHVLEELQLFPGEFGGQGDQSGDVAPGRARLATRPLPTGSPTPAMTMGIVVVACLRASAAGVATTIRTSTLRRTSSAARAGSRSYCPAA